ncbi:maltose/maltodextrin ABC transporter, permease protein MalG [Lachnospiraceae bacterium KM106-2]|nr:maltose/maltodextrin ABC transporter, permease protein MalG [Lachnospiraceae bacterium KM106-2]
MKRKRIVKDILSHALLIALSIVWLIPIVWVVAQSFNEEQGAYFPYFFPKKWSFCNYISLWTDNTQFMFGRWYLNTLIVAVFCCIISTFFVLSVSFVLSRMRFKARKPLMNVALVLGMFPGFMSMIAVYYILKGIGITQSLFALILVYSGSAGLSYYIAKGFFDTIPKAIDEAAYIDGATKFQVFTRITMPLSKPIVIYTVLTSFTAPWLDYIFASVIMGDKYERYTVSIGLWTMVQQEYVQTWFTRFTAGAVCVSIPIALLFIVTQKYYVEGLSGAVKG